MRGALAEYLREFPELLERLLAVGTKTDVDYNSARLYFLLEDGAGHAAESLLLLALRHGVDEAGVYYL